MHRMLVVVVLLLVSLSVGECYYPADGRSHRSDHPAYGAAGEGLLHQHTDPTNTIAAATANAREVSRELLSRTNRGVNAGALADDHVNMLLSSWGQVVSHDILHPVSDTAGSPSRIPVPRCDEAFDPECTGAKTLPFGPSQRNADGKVINHATAWLDGSTLYGNSVAVQAQLREFSGGRLKMVDHGATLGEMPQMLAPGKFLQADPRSNVQPGMLALFVVLMREHNRVAAALGAINPVWDDEKLFQEARRHTIATIQAITETEYLPLVLGKIIPPISASTSSAAPNVDTVFGAAAFRYGHAAVRSVFPRSNPDGTTPHPSGPILLRDIRMNAAAPLLEAGVEPVLRGMAHTLDGRAANAFLSRDLVDNLMESLGMDLGAINVQRSRDWNIPLYTDLRTRLGLTPVNSFDEIPMADIPGLREKLATIYGNDVHKMDAYVGGLLEVRQSAHVGPLFAAVIEEQFLRTRDADPTWYSRGTFPLYEDPPARLSAVIARNMVDAASTPSTNNNRDTNRNSFVVANRCTGGGLGAVGAGSLQLDDTLALEWTMDDANDAVRFTLTGPTEAVGGYMAIGIGSDPMNNVDIMKAYMDERGVPAVADAFAPSFNPTDDRDLGGTNDIIAGSVDGSIVDGMTSISWSRKWETGDSNDLNLQRDGTTDMIFAHHPTDTDTYHGASNRGSFTVDLAAGVGASLGDSGTAVRLLHGMAMLVGWSVLMPIGALIARYYKTWADWVTIHQVLQSVGAASTLPLGVAAIATVSTHGTTPHALTGLTVLALTTIEVFLGNLVAYLRRRKSFGKTWVTVLRWTHRINGTCLIIAAQAQVILGLTLFGVTMHWVMVYVGWVVVLVVVFAVHEIRKRSTTAIFVGDREQAQSSLSRVKGAIAMAVAKRTTKAATVMSSLAGGDSGEVGGYTMDEFAKLCSHGRRLIIIDNNIYDVGDFEENHPGGTYIMGHLIGRDATSAFWGYSEDPDVARFRHGHSFSAMAKLRSLKLAPLVTAAKPKKEKRKTKATKGKKTKKNAKRRSTSKKAGGDEEKTPGEEGYGNGNGNGYYSSSVDSLYSYHEDTDDDYEDGDDMLACYTMEQVQHAVKEDGKEWLVVDELIIDVSRWKLGHPGGQGVLLKNLGKDISKIFAGEGSHHPHSAFAHQRLLALAVGHLQNDDDEDENGDVDAEGVPALIGASAKSIDSGQRRGSTCASSRSDIMEHHRGLRRRSTFASHSFESIPPLMSRMASQDQEDSKRLPRWTRKQFFEACDTLTDEGTKRILVLLDGFVLDVTSWAFSHPGGEQILRRHSSMEIGVLMRGGDMDALHDHSDHAQHMASTMRIACLHTDGPDVAPILEAGEHGHGHSDDDNNDDDGTSTVTTNANHQSGSVDSPAMKALANASLKFRSVVHARAEWTTMVLESKVKLLDDTERPVWHLVFTLDPDTHMMLGDAEAGQHVRILNKNMSMASVDQEENIQRALDEGITHRAYTIADVVAWNKHSRGEFIIRQEPHGVLSTFLANLAIGEGVKLSAPVGMPLCVQFARYHRLAVIVGGTGVVPILAALRQWHYDPASRGDTCKQVYIVYAISGHQPFLLDEIKACTASLPFCHITTVLSNPDDNSDWPADRRGRVTKELLSNPDVLPQVKETETEKEGEENNDTADLAAFVCGPLPFQAAVNTMLEELNYPKAGIHLVQKH